MGVKRMFDLVIPVPGREKTAWQNLGILMEMDDGRMSVKLNSLPIGIMADSNGNAVPWDGWIKVFPKEDRAQQSGGRTQGSGNNSGRQGGYQGNPMDDPNDNIPF